MAIADKIREEVLLLPDELAREVLDFIGYLGYRHGLSDQPVLGDLEGAQEDAMRNVWDNPDDEVWNNVQTR